MNTTATTETPRYLLEDMGTPVSMLEDFTTPLESYQNTLIIGDDSNSSEDLFVKNYHFIFANFAESISILNSKPLAAIFIVDSQVDNKSLHFNYAMSFAQKKRIPVILYTPTFKLSARKMALDFKFDDYYCGQFTMDCVNKIKLIKKLSEYRYNQIDARTQATEDPKEKKWYSKRAFDIVFSLSIILLISPILLLIALIIKLESKGPVFYISKRAGTGYKIFDFYKFRSMRKGADKDLKKLSDKNQYTSSVFFKIQNDPRVTPFGKFLRNTSLDELPQLFNVLKGDMSLVGNRPLPLYEAEKLTRDGDVRRFLAPAGITGLWQVTKRGKKDMSDTERIQLDVIYSRKFSFAYDLKILLSTFPALIQQEKV